MAALDAKDLAGEFWFTALLPLAIGLAYELGTRLAHKGGRGFDHADWFIALPAMGAAVTAVPPLTALSILDAERQAVDELAIFGGFVATGLVITAFVFALIDGNYLARHRSGGTLAKRMLVTWVPNAIGIATAIGALRVVAP